MSLGNVVEAFWWGFIPAALFALPVFRVLLAWKSRQTISEYAPEGHQVKQGTPTMGGLIIVLGALVPVAWFSLNGFGEGSAQWWLAALVLLLGFAAIGFIDDFVVPRMFEGKRGLGWKQKIVMQVVVALGAAAMIFDGLNAASLICTFVILFYSNAYNFSDGLDALAGALLLSLAAGIAVIAAVVGVDQTALPLMAILFGAVIPFLFLNAPPAKVFMGDVGSLPIGALLGAAVCVVSMKGSQPSLFGVGFDWNVVAAVKVLSLVMVIELVPVPLQIFWVKVFKKRLFPYTPIHHAFEKAGWKETRVVGMFALTQLLLAALAVTLVAMR